MYMPLIVIMVCSHCLILRLMVCIELCGGVHTARRQTSTQIPVGFCVNLLVSVSVAVSVFALVSGSMNAPLSLTNIMVVDVRISVQIEWT